MENKSILPVHPGELIPFLIDSDFFFLLKVDDHKNKSIISPGKLVGLNVFSQLYVGGYSEYIPDLLPRGADFKNGFQGKTWMTFTLYLLVSKFEEKKVLLRSILLVPKPAMWTAF